MTTRTTNPHTTNTCSSNTSRSYHADDTDSAESTNRTERVRPVHQIRLGTIKAAIWANPTNRNTVMYTVTLQRSYKTGGLWKRSDTFRRDDLLTAAKALDLAHSWIHREQQQAGRSAPAA